MRVISGTARSINLITPKGLDTRPTVDKYKETLFNCIQNDVGNCIFVDLFAGSGAIGIEALSRGASKCYFVEKGNEAIRCIKENLKKTHLEDKAIVCQKDVLYFIKAQLNEIPDIIFLDPPFKGHLEDKVLPLLVEENKISEDTLIIVECDFDADFDYLDGLGLEIYKVKNYKTNQHVFIRRK